MIPGGAGGALVGLVVVLLVGVAAGRAKQRFSLLLLGLVVAVVGGVLVAGLGAGGTGLSTTVPAVTAAAMVVIPLAFAFVAGWLCARGTWFGRFLIVVLATLLLAALPYPAVGQAVAELLGGQGVGAAG